MLRFPDGSYLPALNGVQNPAPMAWPPGRPFSPVLGKRFTGDKWWYEHADGTMTTTEMQWRSDLGRTDAMTHVATPQPVMPVEQPDPVEPPKVESPKK